MDYGLETLFNVFEKSNCKKRNNFSDPAAKSSKNDDILTSHITDLFKLLTISVIGHGKFDPRNVD